MNCHFTVIAAALGCCVLYPSLSKAEVPMPLSQPEIAQAWQLAESGDFAGAEARLKAMIEQADAPVTSLPAIALEQLRRIRLDYDQTPEALLEKLKRSIPRCHAGRSGSLAASGRVAVPPDRWAGVLLRP
jgi:hypothetical protein